MQGTVSGEMVEKWIRGWSLSRQLPLPTQFQSGFKVEVGLEKQKARYVFPNLNQDFVNLGKLIAEPWIFLKVCAAPHEVKNLLPKRWKLQPQGYMMKCFHPMTQKASQLDDHYKIELETYNTTHFIKLKDSSGSLAAAGRVVLVDDLAIYDRISTDSNHRRKGLATFVMKTLEKIALSHGVNRNFLVATEEGRQLYEYLGWELYCCYSSFLISDG